MLTAKNILINKFKKKIKLFLPYEVSLFLRKFNLYRKNINSKKEKDYVFDIITSIGVSCRPTHYLNKHKLRIYASPLDWVGSYSLDAVFNLYKSNFDNFFINYSTHKQNSNWFFDNINEVRAMHYPEIGIDNISFNKRMKKRFKKLNKKLNQANKICFISNRSENHESLLQFLKKIGSLYSGKITLINIKNNTEIDEVIKLKKIKINDRLELIQYEFKDIHSNGGNKINNSDFWLGNIQKWDRIINKIQINSY